MRWRCDGEGLEEWAWWFETKYEGGRDGQWEWRKDIIMPIKRRDGMRLWRIIGRRG